MDDVTATASASRGYHSTASAFTRQLVIGLIAFLTVVDFLATQAILPSLAQTYGYSCGPRSSLA